MPQAFYNAAMDSKIFPKSVPLNSTTLDDVAHSDIPTLVSVYALDPPLDISMGVNEQAEAIYSSATLVETNTLSASKIGIESPEKFVGLSIEEISRHMGAGQDLSETRKKLIARLQRFILNGYTLDSAITSWSSSDNDKWFKTSYYGLVSDGKLHKMVTLYQHENTHREQERLVSDIANNLENDSEEELYSSLTRRLAQTLSASFASVLELAPHVEGTVSSWTMYDSAKRECASGIDEFPIRNPAIYKASQGDTIVIEHGASDQFDKNQIVHGLAVDSLVAVPVMGLGEKPLALLLLMNKGPLANLEFIRSVLALFAIRIGAEIERRKFDEERRTNQQHQTVFIENSSSGMAVMEINPPMSTSMTVPQQVVWMSENTRVTECNSALVELLGYRSKKALIGHSLISDLVRFDFATQARDFIGDDYSCLDYVVPLVTAKGKAAWISANLAGEVVDGKLTKIYAVMSDVSERIRYSREMEHRANHDGLTGLPNRNYFVEQLDQLLGQSRPDSNHALLILDLDGFKEVNDTLGHETGDLLLQQIGPRVSEVLSREKTLFARLGGDEFAVLLEDCVDEETITSMAADLMAEIRSPFTINELELVVGGSVGIAVYPEHGDTSSSLMRCADIAMYQAKQRSQDFKVYSSDSDHYTLRRLSLMMDIRHAVQNDELRLFYQPIVDIEDQNVIGFEALIRWFHPELGMLPPGEFIPLIELTDTIMPVTWWVVETAVKQLAQWQEMNWNYRVSVNVSTRNLVDNGFVSFIESCLQRYGVNGKMLEIEITESTLMADPEKARKVLQSIAELGVLISVDDYGTGYSSLAYLKSLPIDTLKIDRTFISQMLADSQDEIIVRSTIQLAHNLGLRVTAEGIEDVSLIRRLHELGCDKGQGYFFCKPLPMEDLLEWLPLHQRRITAA